jgi:NAD(P)-dependent dehydrogenase (short-subunit alcohol dehydrogenase family)
VIVTGSNCGIGKATALQLAKRGGKIYFACRNEQKTLQAINEIKQETKNEDLHFIQLDLTSFDSIRRFAKKFHELESRLDVLINNAGVLSPLDRTKEGFELNFGVNHLGHFLLTHLLLDLLKASAPSRIIIVASELYAIGNVNKEDLNYEKSFPGTWRAYGNSKLCNILFMRELSKKLEGSGVVCNALCPGAVNTEATRYLNPIAKFFMQPMMRFFYNTPEMGAQTIIFLAVEPSIGNESGCFYMKCKKKELYEKAKNNEIAEWLWSQSLTLTGLNK